MKCRQSYQWALDTDVRYVLLYNLFYFTFVVYQVDILFVYYMAYVFVCVTYILYKLNAVYLHKYYV